MSMTAAQRKQIAEELGQDEQYLYQCMTGRATMEAKKVMRLEIESGGRLTRQMLRPLDYWEVWAELPRQVQAEAGQGA